MKASIEQAGQALEVKLRNLSAEGALVEGLSLPVEGSELMFIKGDLRVPGKVAWTHGPHAGIAFSKLLDPVQLMRHVPAPKARTSARFRRPGLALELTEAERRFGENWLSGIPVPPAAD